MKTDYDHAPNQSTPKPEHLAALKSLARIIAAKAVDDFLKEGAADDLE